ncbi:hypothetical protein [Natronobiforma cellulositropha]|uniref:hypothetical protein n=1 Tax=Natronobiforma cellulositropha TaxID=1679076 RepID=UPI0021D58D8A|nr:hypothetical protein [Natronobiforma cellulositropha]
MRASPTPLEYVFASAARRETLRTLASAPADRRTVVEQVDACESAVYDAFVGLAEFGLVARTGERWSLTGRGRLIADALDHCQRLDEVTRTCAPFWERHDAAVVPRSIRASLVRSSWSVVDASSSAPLSDLLAAARDVGVILGSDDSPLVTALETVSSARIVILGDTGAGGLETDTDRRDARFDSRVRTHPDATDSYTMVVTDDVVALALPTTDGRLEHRQVLVVDDGPARTACWRHFRAVWLTARPLESADRQLSRTDTDRPAM